MKRYFIEVSYIGANYAGFQRQKNANSIEAEIEKALSVFFRDKFQLVCSSRTDAGVHALSNFFHFDTKSVINSMSADQLKSAVYNLNAILPSDIVVSQIFEVAETSHCRFNAISREYHYYIYQTKNPFYEDRAYYYPYNLDLSLLQHAADILLKTTDFATFSKKHSQVKSFDCNLVKSKWSSDDHLIKYVVVGNRFLRGMVRGLVGTMLRVGTGKTSLAAFESIVSSGDNKNADFSVPAHGLFLKTVVFDFSADRF